ncbi:MAG TPA: DNA gyrase subunit A [Candidatus Azoamicus sp. OHIO1]
MSIINNVNIEEELSKSYLDYAISVIVGRALPDIRDGLKPVHRRILYAMKELGNSFDRDYKKSARVAGDVIGKYHPHGESAVYDSIVRLAQSFVQRYSLIDGHGNFGSIDGDSPAAMRYTEIRMSEIADYLLRDLDFDTVDYVSNYDNTEIQPVVLPSMIPNLLINGASGIAVGMATNIPPHNISEVIDGCIAVIKNPNITVDKLMNYILGPDFPTYANINGIDGIFNAYKTGKGKICIRANHYLEDDIKTGRKNIIVNELPYQVNKAKLIEKISLLVKEKKIDGIYSLRDESDKDGMRIFISVNKDKDPNVILNNLYSLTSLQSIFNVNMVALVNECPKLLNLKKLIEHFINHRKEIVYRRTQFKLKKARSKVHLLEGLLISLLNISSIIDLVKFSDSIFILKDKLLNLVWNSDKIFSYLSNDILDLCRCSEVESCGFVSGGYKFSILQVNSILDLKLYKLTKLEFSSLVKEYIDISVDIKYYLEILLDSKALISVLEDELIFIKNKFGDSRRTRIISDVKSIVEHDLVLNKNIIITLSFFGYIKSQLSDIYQSQHRGGKGKIATLVKDEDFIFDLLVSNTHSVLLCFSNFGKAYSLDLSKFPISLRSSRGIPIVNLLTLKELERINVMLSLKHFHKDSFVFMVTRNGLIKKVSLSEFKNCKNNGILSIRLLKDDVLVDVSVVDEETEIALFSNVGKSVRFLSSSIRCTGRSSCGIRGIKLGKKEEVISLVAIKSNNCILSVTKNGYGKRTLVREYPITSRGGKGVIDIKVNKRNGNVVKVEGVSDKDELILITNKGTLVRMKVDEVSCFGRNTNGVLLMNLSKDEYLVSVKKIS